MSTGEPFSVPFNPTAPADPPADEKPKRGRPPRRAPGEVNGERHDHDAYDTDPALALACVLWAGSCLTRTNLLPNVLEPTAGGGPFVRAARVTWPNSRIIAVDIDVRADEACRAAGADKVVLMDALKLPPAPISKCDLIITNPPFKLADQLVRHFWPHMHEGASLAFLLSVTFVASSDRWVPGSGLFEIAPLHYMIPIVPRPTFIGGKSPQFEAALFVWTKGAELFPIGKRGALIPNQPIRWEKPKRTRKAREPKP